MNKENKLVYFIYYVLEFASRINPVWNEGIELDIKTGQE